MNGLDAVFTQEEMWREVEQRRKQYILAKRVDFLPNSFYLFRLSATTSFASQIIHFVNQI